MFRRRSEKKELLDNEDIPRNDLITNLKELDFINHWLGGYQISFAALKKVLKKGQTYILVDIGSGGGDTLKRIGAWSKKSGHDIQLFGVDIKPVCIEYATQNVEAREIQFVCDDYRNVGNHIPKIDILHASLFCHHLQEIDLVELVRFAVNINSVLIINDLERNPLAYFSIKWLTALFSNSYLVKNDAPLSVLRGFKRKEWRHILTQAGAKKYTIINKWAFRHEVIVYG